VECFYDNTSMEYNIKTNYDAFGDSINLDEILNTHDITQISNILNANEVMLILMELNDESINTNLEIYPKNLVIRIL